MQKKKSILLLLSLSVFISSLAQQTSKQEINEVYFTIDPVLRSNDTIIATIKNADSIFLPHKAIVKAWQSHRDAVPGLSEEKDLRPVGSGYIYLYDSIKFCYIILDNKNDSMEYGDMISIRLSMPALPYRSIFSRLAFYNINFGNIFKKPLYHLDEIIYRDSKELEDSIYSAIISDLQKSYDSVKNRTNLPKELLTILTDGRLKGKSPLEIIRDVTRKDLEGFFLYATKYPARYMGNNFRASESFAGWLTGNAPYSHPEIKNALFPIYKNKALFTSELQKYKYDILNESAVQSLAEEVIDLINELRFKEAEELVDFVLTLAYAVKDSSGIAIAHITKAQIYQDQEKYPKAIIECDKTLKIALLSKNRNWELQALIKKGYNLFKISKYKESQDVLQSAKTKLTAYRFFLNNSDILKNTAAIYRYLSTISYNSANYNKSLQYIDSAIFYNTIINTHESRLENAGYLKLQGKIFNAQGKPSDAIDATVGAFEIYRNNKDIANQASTQNELADIYFSMGYYRNSIEFATDAHEKFLSLDNPDQAGYSLSVVGQSYWGLGKYDSAVLTHLQAIGLRKKSGNISGIAWSWEMIGKLYRGSLQKQSALNAYDTAMEYYKRAQDSSGLQTIHNLKGLVYLDDENYKKSATLFEAARSLNSKTSVESLYNLGLAWFSIDSVKAKAYLKQARTASMLYGDIGYEFNADELLAMLAYQSGNKKTGDNYFSECLSLTRKIKTVESRARCMNLKAFSYENESILDSAMVYYDSAMNMMKDININFAINRMNNIANVHISEGEFRKAESILTDAINQSKLVSYNYGLGNTLGMSSFLYALTGEYAKGLSNNDTAISIFKESGNNIRLANTLTFRGSLLNSMGNYKTAIATYLTADSIYKDELIYDSRAGVFNNIGLVYRKQNDFTTAVKYFDMALKLAPKGIINELYLIIQGNKAECLHFLQKSKEAEKLSLEIYNKSKTLKLNRIASGMAITLGNLYFDQNNISQAAKYFNEAMTYAAASGEIEKKITALTFLGRIYAIQNKNTEAEVSFRQSLQVINEFQYGIGWESFYEMGLLLFNRKQFDSSAQYFKKAIDILEKNMENLFGGDDAKKIYNNDPRKADLYYKTTFSYFKLGNFDEAFVYGLRYNIAGIKEMAGSLSLTGANEAKNEILKIVFSKQQELQAQKNIAEKQEGEAKVETLKKVKILEAKYLEYIENLNITNSELSIYLKGTNAEELKTYKNKIKPDEAVLLYIQNKQTLMIICLTKEGLFIDTTKIETNLLVDAFIASIRDTKTNTGTPSLAVRSEPLDEDITYKGKGFKELSGQLYKILIAPVYNEIKNKKRICIIPTGIYSNLPFQCLGKSVSETEFRFLIEEHSIFYTNNMSIFNNKEEFDAKKNNLNSFAAFGVPDATLSYNIGEVKLLGEMAHSDSTIYTDKATESQAKQSLENKKIIHFATHGVLNYSSDYSLSYLKLLPDKDSSNGNNGRLTMREVKELTINDCNMVVLSACETAVSKDLVKGWKISPANSFLISNVKSVVASLWKVADEPTSLLMKYFYKNLEKMDKAEALREAQITLSQDKRFTHPNYWGAFALYGDWR